MKRKGYAQSNQIFAKISLFFYALSVPDWTYKITRAIILFYFMVGSSSHRNCYMNVYPEKGITCKKQSIILLKGIKMICIANIILILMI